MDATEAPSAYVDGFTVPVAGIAAVEVAFVGHRFRAGRFTSSPTPRTGLDASLGLGAGAG